MRVECGSNDDFLLDMVENVIKKRRKCLLFTPNVALIRYSRLKLFFIFFQPSNITLSYFPVYMKKIDKFSLMPNMKVVFFLSEKKACIPFCGK